MPTDDDGSTMNVNIAISPSAPTRGGYRFLGWCNTIPTTTDGADTCSGTTYQPNSTYTLDQTSSSNNLPLTAMWQEEKTIANSTTMQEVESCPASLATNQVYTIKDSRDNTEYHAARLADGKCWLLDNLALDLTDSTVLNNMNQSNTNATNTTLNYLKNGGGTAFDQNATVRVANWTSGNPSFPAPLVNLTSKDVIPADATSTAGGYKVGGYYNYCAASAGSYCYGDDGSYGTSSGNATEDICPKGWRMPTGSSFGEYSALANSIYGSTDSTTDVTAIANYRSALRLPLSGYFTGVPVYQGYNGFFWSSTRYNNGDMYLLYQGNSYINLAYENLRNYGYSVRCILDQTPTMQEQTPSSLNTLLPNVGDTAILKDVRDNQKYTVGKLADDKYWMTENLNLAGGTALSASDTDVTSTYISSFTTSNNLTKSGDTIVLPASSTSGFTSDNYSYVYNSGNKTNCGASGQNTPCYSYYSWDAATLGSGRTIATDNTDAEQSICPKGWRLPTSGNESNSEWKRGDFYALATAYGANIESSYIDISSVTGANFYNNAGLGTVPNFLLAGYYSNGSFYYGGSYGSYWSSTSYSSTSRARHLYFLSSRVSSASYDNRYLGFGVRCLFSGQ